MVLDRRFPGKKCFECVTKAAYADCEGTFANVICVMRIQQKKW